MKKKAGILIVLTLIVVTCCFTGCSLFGSSGALSKPSTTTSSSNNSTTVVNYEDMSKEDLADELTKYREMVETYAARMETMEDAVRDSIVSSKTNIGAYAVNYVDCVMNISCMESQYNLGCQGTGFVISEDGYVITNNHVIYYEETVYDTENVQRGWFGYSYGTKVVNGVYSTIYAVFDQASVYYNQEKTYTLQFIYRDPDLDLALCKLVEAAPVGDHWKAIPFYEGSVSRGDEVLVLGNAQGFGLSATAGLVSATGKLFEDSPKLSFIQTDAAINGGNSGGPAINIYGGLIGVVNSKFVSSSIENMGFAIELSKVKDFLLAAQTEKGITITTKTVSSQNA